ncbi:MAG: ABC transporter permease [Blastocatellia bacterium]|nr:ABC transporter permease [Blastocatellia bacterium]
MNGNDSPGLPVTRIQASRGWVSLKLAEVWEFRELLYFLIWRDVKVRYKQTLVGAGWAIIQPVFTMAVFSIFFGRLAKMPSDGIPYPVFSLAALVPWTFFANALTQAANSLATNANLVTKVYFPRLIIPTAGVLAGLFDLAISFVVLVGLMGYYGIFPKVQMLAFPLFIGLAVVAAMGVGLWMAAVNVEYRDVRYALPFVVQFWMFATPIAYSSTLVPPEWRTLYAVNPMVGVIEGIRWSLLGTGSVSWGMLAVSCLVALGLLISGAFYFRRMEKDFADRI